LGSKPGPGAKPALGLVEVPAGARILIDANIFIYHFTGASGECTQFLERCERGEVVGVTGVHLLLEVLHRLMMIEAVVGGLVTPGDVARKLRERPEVVRRLHRYQEQVELILGMGIEVLPLEAGLIELSRPYREEHGLLVNDSLTLALVEGLGLEGLATADEGLLRLGDELPFHFYAPQDLR
jgi:predicted nucleic acid-binding protein